MDFTYVNGYYLVLAIMAALLIVVTHLYRVYIENVDAQLASALFAMESYAEETVNWKKIAQYSLEQQGALQQRLDDVTYKVQLQLEKEVFTSMPNGGYGKGFKNRRQRLYDMFPKFVEAVIKEELREELLK